MPFRYSKTHDAMMNHRFRASLIAGCLAAALASLHAPAARADDRPDEKASLEQLRGVRFEFGERIDSPSAVMDSALSARMAKICRRREIPFIIRPSGAGHDAALFSNAGVPSGMVFVRNAFGSHNPQESMSIGDFLLAADVLYDCMLSL